MVFPFYFCLSMAKYYLIAGEASGDLHGSNLIKSLKSKDHEAIFKGFGGDKMQDQGCDLTYHYKEIAFMGIKEVALNFKKISKALKTCKNDVLEFQPDVIILIDYPGFNFRIAEFAKEKGFKTIYYIAPQLWAWKEGRIKKLKNFVDKTIVILPFEKDFYKKHDYSVDYVGHPLLDVIENYIPNTGFRSENTIDDKPIIAILPGSRKQEIEKILPVQAKMVDRFPDYNFVVAGTSQFSEKYYKEIAQNQNIKVVFNKTYDLVTHAQAGLVTSGTATLESALLGMPLIVCYKTSKITYSLFKRFAKVQYISLVNLILNKLAIKELIQDDLNEENIYNELNSLLTEKERLIAVHNDFEELRKILDKKGAPDNAADIILDNI